MRIVWSPTSQRKIDEIVAYISKDDNVDAALALVEKFEKTSSLWPNGSSPK